MQPSPLSTSRTFSSSQIDALSPCNMQSPLPSPGQPPPPSCFSGSDSAGDLLGENHASVSCDRLASLIWCPRSIRAPSCGVHSLPCVLVPRSASLWVDTGPKTGPSSTVVEPGGPQLCFVPTSSPRPAESTPHQRPPARPELHAVCAGPRGRQVRAGREHQCLGLPVRNGACLAAAAAEPSDASGMNFLA